MHKYILFSLVMFAAATNAVAQSQDGSGVKHVQTSDGVDLYVTVKGSGTPCLYIHGGPGSGSWWLEKFSGAMLEKRFQMIYLDQRGVCRSTSPGDGNYTMERMVRDFEEVRKALGIRKWITLGHSFGGILQMGYARSHPEVITGMIMLNCSLCIEASAGESIPKACEFLGIADTGSFTDKTVPLLERWSSVMNRMREKNLFWKMQYASLENKKVMDASFNDIPDWNKDQENNALAVRDYWEDYRRDAPGMTMPVLFFYGKTDWGVGPEHHKGVHFPNMMRWGSDVGHVPFLENPADLEKAIDSYRKKFAL